ncbi:MAG TPA: 4-(cytidine 5'-diphospho)-2-C-methyl-D-erythritol kinase [Gammaproteobacteria bacterium]|nr:4-(cytidine 5'-diphospho)-2-C-methyl-D-erythritol kinase [Gammaproteobacteria bacterium]
MADGDLTSTGWPAPAKLNLFLHVIGRRRDGYHLLQTVFQFVTLADQLDFQLCDDGRILRHADYDDIPPDADLAVRAARLLQVDSRCRFGAGISIRKKVPTGGGLGGGSSNAATTLVALNRLWQTGYSSEDLAGLGLQLGADVPIFIHGQAAWAEGVGEEFTPVEPEEPWYLILQPDCEVSTATVFASADLTRHTPAITIRDFLAHGGHNDCEPVVRNLYPKVAAAMDWLGEHAEARMTGTGACVFAAFSSYDAAERVRNRIPREFTGYVCKGSNRSLLLERLGREVT